MLTRRYELRICTGNLEYPFVIQNAPTRLRSSEDDVGTPSREEMMAPGLKLRVFQRDGERFSKTMRRFRDALDSGYLDTEVPDCIADAMCGLKSEWKIIRVVPQHDSTFFVLTNPHIFNQDLYRQMKGSLGDGLDQSMRTGLVWIYLSNGFFGAFEISVLNDKGRMTEKYVMHRRWYTRFEFEEYNDRGLFRWSEVEKDEEDGYSTINVTEYL